jgi:hypothetical protein
MMESLVGYPNELLILLVIIIIAQFIIRLITSKIKIRKETRSWTQ